MGSAGYQLPMGNEEIVTEFKWEKWEVEMHTGNEERVNELRRKE